MPLTPLADSGEMVLDFLRSVYPAIATPKSKAIAGTRTRTVRRVPMWVYNSTGVFGNREDSAEGLRKVLEELFEESEVRVVGVVALFWAREPRAVAA
ncbi:hypothetical protein BD413DRAFT_614202 [Trametes elegans]|nr:hypothetical protein BD413DRAFT_614202 [Trametes elegans]